MSDNKEQRIRERAHAIWQAEGQVHGRDKEHWERATRELAADEPAGAPAVAGEAPVTSVKRPRRKGASAAAVEPAPAPASKPRGAKAKAELPAGVEPVAGFEEPAAKSRRKPKPKS